MEDLLNRNQKGGLYSVASEEAWEGFKQESKDPVCVSEKALWQGHGEQIAEGGDKEGQGGAVYVGDDAVLDQRGGCRDGWS